MTQPMQRKLRQIEDMLGSGLDAQKTSRILTLLGWSLTEPNILDEINIVSEFLPESVDFPLTQNQRYTHFLWDAFEKLPISLITPFSTKLRSIMAANLFRNCGCNFTAQSNISFNFGQNLDVGDNVSIGRNVSMDTRGGIILGDSVYLGDNVSILTHAYSTDNQIIKDFNTVIIENGARIEAHVTIFPGVTIGEDTVVSPGSIVTRSIPANVIVAGVPAQIIRDFRNIQRHIKAA